MTQIPIAELPPATPALPPLPAWRSGYLGTRARIVALVLLAALPFLALIGYSTWDERRRAEAEARYDMTRLATIAAQRQEQIIEGARQTLVAIAQSPIDDQARCNEFLAKLLAESAGIYHTMGIYRADAILICNALPWQGEIYSPDRLYFRIPMATGKFAIGEYQIGRVTKQQGINIGYPLADTAGKVMAIAFVAIDLARLNLMAAATPLPDTAILTVVDRDGVILARIPEQAGRIGKKLQNPQVLKTVLSGKSGVFHLKASDDVERLWAYASVADNPDGVTPLRVLISIPMSVVFAAVDRANIRNFISIVMGTILLVIFAWYGVEYFVFRKVRVLLDAAGRVHTGDFDVRTGMLAEDDELSQIGAAFDEMTTALQIREAGMNLLLGTLNEQATTDPLTGLYNRRYLMEFLHRELARAGRSASYVAAIMLDIDYFKRINDSFGHAAGDLVLTAIADLLKRHIRDSDIACRYGGEEFVLILADAALEGALQRAESIRKLTANLELKYADQALGPITMSFGVAVFPDHATDARSLIQAADEALYQAKNLGRDRVVSATVPGYSAAFSMVAAAG